MRSTSAGLSGVGDIVITTNVRLTANSIAVYEELFERNQVTLRTGITKEGLRSVGKQIQDYFNSDREPLVVLAEVNGVERSLFGADEASHMADVKVLFLRTYRLQEASALFLAVAAVAVLATRRRSGLLDIASWMRRGAVLTIAAIAVLGIGSVVAFDQVFEQRHAQHRRQHLAWKPRGPHTCLDDGDSSVAHRFSTNLPRFVSAPIMRDHLPDRGDDAFDVGLRQGRG